MYSSRKARLTEGLHCLGLDKLVVRSTGRDLISNPGQHAVQSGGLVSLLGAQATIAGAHGQAISISDRRQALYLNLHMEVGNHALNDAQLLEVLLAEHGDVGPDQIE